MANGGLSAKKKRSGLILHRRKRVWSAGPSGSEWCFCSCWLSFSGWSC